MTPKAFARVPVLALATSVTVVLLLLAQWHGFHRDELYFIVAGRHLALGYPDQPPLTPLLSATAVTLFGVEAWAVRVLPAIVAGLSIVVVAAMARDMGGQARAQVLAAITFGLSGLLAIGHLGSTATYELFLWTVVMWMVVRLLAGGDPRLWLVVGLVSGVALENKQTALILGAGLFGGVVLARRWAIVRSPWLWLGGLVALLLWAPNLAWQAANDFPQLEMAGDIAEEALENRILLVPELLLLAGPFLFPVFLAGIWRLARSPVAVPWRAIPYGFAVVLGIVLLTGGKSYYATGMSGPFIAAGALALDGWLARGHVRLRQAIATVAAILSGVAMAILTLPVLPPSTLAQTPIPEIYAESAEQVGWPELVETVERAAARLPPVERAASIVLTGNYGEAGALELLGKDLPLVFSGHNGFGYWGPPPDEAKTTVLVGNWDPAGVSWAVGRCELAGRVDNGFDLQNEEQGAGVWLCRDHPVPWSQSWPALRHLD